MNTLFWIVEIGYTKKFFRSDSPNKYSCFTWNASSNDPNVLLISYCEAEGTDVKAIIEEAMDSGRYKVDKDGVQYYRAYNFYKHFQKQRQTRLAA